MKMTDQPKKFVISGKAKTIIAQIQNCRSHYFFLQDLLQSCRKQKPHQLK